MSESKLTGDQSEAFDALLDFLDSGKEDVFLLEGGAGTGKTYLIGALAQMEADRACWAAVAVTHKAVGVMREKLTAFGVPWTTAHGARPDGDGVVTGTTAGLLGIGPDFESDNVSAAHVPFAPGKLEGFFRRIAPAVVVVDEASMLPKEQLEKLIEVGGGYCKIILVGDKSQLPPVKATPIDWDSFVRRAQLREITRQAETSAIIRVGQAIRNGEDWTKVEGPGVRHTRDLVEDFLDVVQPPGKRTEREREVFIAYTNARVDAVQSRACKKLYGHGHLEVEPGEVVLSDKNFQNCCSNQEELRVLKVGERDPTFGVALTLKRCAPEAAPFDAFYLTPREARNPNHPFNLELKERLHVAEGLQREKRQSHAWSDASEDRRREAWRKYYAWKDGVITFHHPFAITSHKSQGSTYRQVFADTNELAGWPGALYVAVTRPAEELVLPVAVPVATW